MKKLFKISAIVLSIVLVLLSAGCAKKTGKTELNLGESKYGDTYPIDTENTVSWWIMNPLAPGYDHYSEQPIYKAFIEETGVNVEFINPAASQIYGTLDLLLASDDVPDIITANWPHLLGGPQKYIDEGAIIPLTEVIDKYAPNLKKYLSENPEFDRQVRIDTTGDYYCFPVAFKAGSQTAGGPIIRADLLEKYNLEEPTTVDEWYTVLKTFKDNGVKYPLCIRNGDYILETGVGAWHDFYIEDGEFVFGPTQPAWRDYINLLQKWFAEGLIDPDLGSIDNTILEQKIVAGDVAAFETYGSDLGRFSVAGKKVNPSFKLMGTYYPTQVKGEKSFMSLASRLFTGYGASAITTSCKDVELAARVLDYAYSPKGDMLVNFGIEGESYKMIDGFPTFTEKMYDANGQASNVPAYTFAGTGITVSCLIDNRAYLQTVNCEEFTEASKKWSDTEADKRVAPLVILDSEESVRLSGVPTQISERMSSFFYNSIFADKPVSEEEFNAYVDEMNAYGLADYIAAKNKHYKNMMKN